MKVVGILAAMAVLASAGAAQAASGSGSAIINATVQAAGPRTGTNGKSGLNIEGSGAGSFASYGIVDFSGSSFHLTGNTAVSSLTLGLTEFNAAFSLPGSVDIYLAGSAAGGIANDGSSAFKYDPTMVSADPVGVSATDLSSLGGLTLLGTLAYTTTGNVNSGQLDTFSTSTLSAGAQATIASALNNGGTLRLLITQAASASTTMAATYAGYTNTTLAVPQLTLVTNGTTVAAPEPASLGALALGGLTLLARRRKQA